MDILRTLSPDHQSCFDCMVDSFAFTDTSRNYIRGKRVLVRILIIAVAAAIFIMTLSGLTEARTAEVFAAGAT